MYKVLWFDDEHEILEIIIEEALLQGIKLLGVTNAIDGLNMLKNNIYDAVLLDGLFYTDSNKNKDNVSETAFGEVAQFLSDSQNDVPWFVYSGQKTFVKDNNTLVNIFAKNSNGSLKVYDKNNDDDGIKLWQDIIKAIEDTPNRVIQKKYKAVFNICNDEYLGAKSKPYLLETLKIIEKNKLIRTEDLFNGIRKIIEQIFNKLNQLKIIPDEIYNGRGWINKSSLFLANKHSDYNNRNAIPDIIAFLFENILKVTQDASHIEGNLNLEVDKHIKQSKSNYLFYSTTHQLLEIIIWLQTFIANNSNSEINKLKYNIKTQTNYDIWLTGTVIRIADNGWGTFNSDDGTIKDISILPDIVKKFNLKENTKIKVTTKPNKDNTKIHINEIKVIE